MMSEQAQSSDRYVVNSYRAFANLPEALLDRSSSCNAGGFFSSLDWFACLARCGFHESPSLRIIVCRDSQQGDASLYALCLREESRRRRLASLSNYYTIRYPGVCGREAAAAEVLDALVEAMASERPAWSEIELRSLLGCIPATTALACAFRKAGYRVDLYHQHWNWFVHVAGLSYSDYFAARPARLRNTLRRKGQKAAGLHSVRYADFDSNNGLSDGLKAYCQVYERSWKQAEAQPDFLPELISLCAGLGMLRMGVLYLDEVPVAAQFWICSNGVSYIYKLAQDPDYDHLSVGSLLTAHMFEQAIDCDNVSEIDFGTGDEAYKQDWTDARRQLVGLQAINSRTAKGALMCLRLTIRDALRRAGLRQFTPVRTGNEDAGGQVS